MRAIWIIVVSAWLTGTWLGCGPSGPADGGAAYSHSDGEPAFEDWRKEAPLPAGWPAPSRPGRIVVKQYPPVRRAVVRAAPGEDDDDMFGPLFDHIQRRDVPMTAPVVTTYKAAGHPLQPMSMAFLYPSTTRGQPGVAKAVRVEDVGPVTVVSVGVKGAYTQENLQKAADRLTTWLAGRSDQWQAAGPLRRLAYNSPFNFWWSKYAEVQIPIKRANPGE
ncbi:MAG: heme-binding protein [Phycisphaerae bacterium]